MRIIIPVAVQLVVQASLVAGQQSVWGEILHSSSDHEFVARFARLLKYILTVCIGQCGGTGWTGATSCTSGNACSSLK